MPVDICLFNVTQYPQDDYVELNYLYGWGAISYNVKAHSLYLGNMIENGIVGTLCLVAFLAIYFVKGLKKYCRTYKPGVGDRFSYYLGLGLFLGCTAYMISGIINDSNVCTAPIFWAFLGISFYEIE